MHRVKPEKRRWKEQKRGEDGGGGPWMADG